MEVLIYKAPLKFLSVYLSVSLNSLPLSYIPSPSRHFLKNGRGFGSNGKLPAKQASGLSLKQTNKKGVTALGRNLILTK
jgi:hypothetical protein